MGIENKKIFSNTNTNIQKAKLTSYSMLAAVADAQSLLRGREGLLT